MTRHRASTKWMVVGVLCLFFSTAEASGLKNPKALNIRDEGTSQGDAKALDFTGAGVTATVASGVATVTITGGAATAGGTTPNVQFNDSNALAGDPSFNWNKTDNTLGISADAAQTGYALIISSDTGAIVANVSHDGSAYLTDQLDIKDGASEFGIDVGTNLNLSSNVRRNIFSSTSTSNPVQFEYTGSANNTKQSFSNSDGEVSQFVWSSLSDEFKIVGSSSVGRVLVLGDYGSRDQNFDHGVQTNPTLFIHSATQPDSDNTQWIGITHNQTDAYISTGKGNVRVAPIGGVFSVDASVYVLVDITADTATVNPLAYSSAWNGNNTAPTRDDVYDKIETITGAPSSPTSSVQYNNGGAFGGDSSFSWNPTANLLGISRDSGQVGLAIVISNESGVTLASVSHDGGATFNSITLKNRLSVDSGGTGLTSGTSGGVLAFTAAGTISSSNLLTASAVVVGGGSGAAPTTITADTATSGHFLASTAASPAFRQLNTNDVSGTFELAKIQSSSSSDWIGKVNDETGTGVWVFNNSPTLTTPRFADLGYIADSNGNEHILFDQVTSAANYIQVSNDITGIGPTLSSNGSDANVNLRIRAKGTGVVSFDNATVQGPIKLTDAATIATDASLGNTFLVTLGGSRILGTPTNGTHGQKAIWIISQDATGSRTLSYSPAFRFGATVTSPTLSTTAGKQDYIGAIFNVRGPSAAAQSWDVVAVSLGYQG